MRDQSRRLRTRGAVLRGRARGDRGKTLFARRAQLGGGWEASGARDPASWLAMVSGEPRGAARRLLEAADRTRRRPGRCRGTRRRGVLGPPAQGDLPGGRAAPADRSRAGVLGPWAPVDLLGRTAATLGAEACGEEGAEARDRFAHENRHFVAHPDERGGVRGTFSLTDADWAQVAPRIEAGSQRFFEQARTSGHFESLDQHRADALVQLLCATPTATHPTTKDGPRTMAVVRLDAEALVAGVPAPGAAYDVPGVGRVSVDTVRRLLGDALCQVVFSTTQDVTAVSGTTRVIRATPQGGPDRARPTMRGASLRGRVGLQIHHWRQDFSLGGPTCLDNLARVCKLSRHDHLQGLAPPRGPGTLDVVHPLALFEPRRACRIQRETRCLDEARRTRTNGLPAGARAAGKGYRHRAASQHHRSAHRLGRAGDDPDPVAPETDRERPFSLR